MLYNEPTSTATSKAIVDPVRLLEYRPVDGQYHATHLTSRFFPVVRVGDLRRVNEVIQSV